MPNLSKLEAAIPVAPFKSSSLWILPGISETVSITILSISVKM